MAAREMLARTAFGLANKRNRVLSVRVSSPSRTSPRRRRRGVVWEIRARPDARPCFVASRGGPWQVRNCEQDANRPDTVSDYSPYQPRIIDYCLFLPTSIKPQPKFQLSRGEDSDSGENVVGGRNGCVISN